jgi:type II secretory pathway component GspD/PulD (secretin)
MGEELDDKRLTLEIRDQPIDEVFNLVARRYDVSLRQEGKLLFVGPLKPSDKAVMVRRVRRGKADQLAQLLTVYQSEHGKGYSFEDGLLVVGDTVDVLRRIAEMLDQFEAVETPVWIVQLHLVSFTSAAAHDLGVDIEPAARVGLALAAGSAAAAVDTALSVNATLDAVLQIANVRDDVKVTAAPMFLLLDGTKSDFTQGDRVPIPRRTVSNEGTVTTSGYDYVQTGVQVEVALREANPQAARLDVMVSLSDIKRFVGEAPVTGEERFTTAAVVNAGGVYMLGTLVKDRRGAQKKLGWQSGEYLRDDTQVVQVWCQTYRIEGGFQAPEQPPAPVLPPDSIESRPFPSQSEGASPAAVAARFSHPVYREAKHEAARPVRY